VYKTPKIGVKSSMLMSRTTYSTDKMYRGADKSLARPDRKNNWKVAIFRPTRRSFLPRRPGRTDNLPNCFWVAYKR